MLLLTLVGLSQLKLWIEDAAAWARSEVKELDNISKRSSIDGIDDDPTLLFFDLMTRKGVFLI